MSSSKPLARATLRWGGAIAGLLTVQSLLVAGIFLLLATENHVREAETSFRDDCRTYGRMTKGERMEEIREAIDRDIHRDRYLGLFDADGSLLEGNVARLPAGSDPARSSAIGMIVPTELPGKHQDQVRYAVCAIADGTRLLTALDLDDTQNAMRVVERTILIGLLPGLLIAVTVGLLSGRRAARQVDAVRTLTQRIMVGDLQGRLPVADPPDSFGELCLHINQMVTRLEVLVGDMRGIGDDIAHQIRTPLTRLRARVERAMTHVDEPDIFRAAACEALTDVDKVLEIVASLLRIRELEDNERRSRFAAVDLVRIAEDACELHQPGAEDHGMRLACRINATVSVVGDASLLIEAVSNLIDNALKFGPPGGTVTLTLAAPDDVPVITVADQGAGIGVAERRLVTQRFYRGRRDRDGIGLGLSLVQAIVDLHGFALRFEQGVSAVSIVCTPPSRL